MTGTRHGSVVVVATGNPDALGRTVSATASACEVVIVDALELGMSAPAPVFDPHAAVRELGATSVLVLLAGETPTPELLAALPSVEVGVGCVRVVHRGRGWSLEPRRGARRWGPWGPSRLGFAMGRREPATHRLPGAILADHGDVDAMLRELDAVAAAVAALLDAAGVPVGVATTMRAALRRGVSAVTGRAPYRLGWGRWIGAALLAYGDVLAYAKLLERRGRP